MVLSVMSGIGELSARNRSQLALINYPQITIANLGDIFCMNSEGVIMKQFRLYKLSQKLLVVCDPLIVK